MSPRSRAVLPAVLAASLLATSLLSGCAGDAASERASSGTLTPEVSSDAPRTEAASEAETADDGATDAPSFPGDAEADTEEASADEVHFDATYEGTTVAFVGTRTRAPFRVYLLEAPTRVVIEVAHAG